jgi:hypothetical protein
MIDNIIPVQNTRQSEPKIPYPPTSGRNRNIRRFDGEFVWSGKCYFNGSDSRVCSGQSKGDIVGIMEASEVCGSVNVSDSRIVSSTFVRKGFISYTCGIGF